MDLTVLSKRQQYNDYSLRMAFICMMKHILFFMLFFFSFGVFAEEPTDAELEKLLQQVKAARFNGAFHKLPDGIHWIEGYYVSGPFYLCSARYELKFSTEENFKILNNLDKELLHVEMTIENSYGRIKVIEIHSIVSEFKDGCEYVGGGK